MTEGDETGSSEILGPLERRVMAQLWAHGSRSVKEVLQALNAEADRALAYSTVMTILVRLHEKGYLTREKEARHFRYAAAFAESALEGQVGRRELGRLIDRYGVHSIAQFAADLGESDLAQRLAGMASRRAPER